MDIIKAEVGLTCDERAARINQATEDIKRGFMVIATEMAAIKEQLKTERVPGADGRYKGNAGFLAFIEERTGYKKTQVYSFLNAKVAVENLNDFSAAAEKRLPLPENEWVIRPLAKKELNENPERQARAWEIAVELGDGNPTEKDVKKAVNLECEEYAKELGIDLNKKKDVTTRAWALESMLNDAEAAMLKKILNKAAMMYHPDKGGSIEDSQVYNALRSKLKPIMEEN